MISLGEIWGFKYSRMKHLLLAENNEPKHLQDTLAQKNKKETQANEVFGRRNTLI